jgi:hypothetical protein
MWSAFLSRTGLHTGGRTISTLTVSKSTKVAVLVGAMVGTAAIVLAPKDEFDDLDIQSHVCQVECTDPDHCHIHCHDVKHGTCTPHTTQKQTNDALL